MEFIDEDAVAKRDWDTNPDGTVRVAVVGLGGYALEVSLPAIAASDYCEVGAVVSGSPEVRAETAAEHDAVALDYEAYDDGVGADEYDAVYLATPNRRHLDGATTAADHSKAVLSEKPVEATPERAAAVVDRCADAGVTLMTAYRMQTDPVIRRLREWIAAGLVGDPIKAFGDFTFPVLAGDRGPEQWRLDDHLAGGGALFDVGVYPLNTARYLLDADPVAVSGTTRSTEPAFDEVDEHVDFRVEFPAAVGSFSASFSGQADTRLSVLGTAGRVEVVDAFEPDRDRRVRIERGDDVVEFAGLGADETVEEFDYFAHCVLTGERPEPDGRDGLVDCRTMAAVYESARRDERVEVDGP
ncbi:MAG: D-xylose 1-dehydrogenase Gfo6 [Halolamina sp.]